MHVLSLSLTRSSGGGLSSSSPSPVLTSAAAPGVFAWHLLRVGAPLMHHGSEGNSAVCSKRFKKFRGGALPLVL